jgi:transposase-like protein
MVSFQGAHFPQDIILTCVRWDVAYPLSYRCATFTTPWRKTG